MYKKLWLLFLWSALTITMTRGRPITPHNYAPAHEYKPVDYSFSYGVKDLHTGDVKQQWEKKHGQIVTGHYSVLEPDGSLRTVDYTAGGKSGFNAVVKHDIPGHHPTAKEEHPPPLSHSELIIKSEDVDQVYEHNSLHQPQYQQEVDTPQETPDKLVPQYLYLQQEYPGESIQESVDSNIKVSNSNNYLQTIIGKPAIKYQPNEIKSLPIDLNTVKGTTDKIVPVDISLLNPVEIDVNKGEDDYYSVKDTNVQHSQQLSQDELTKFFQQYYSHVKLNEPQLETGFKPIITKPSSVISTQPNNIPIPNTFKSNKKPVTTPGLKNFTSRNKLARARDYYTQPQYYRRNGQPMRLRREEKGQIARRHGVNGGFVKYKKRITMYDD